MSRAADPPSPQEISRKLSLHSVARPKRPIGPVSGTESDSDSALSPDVVSPSTHASSGLTSSLIAGSPQPLSAIAERAAGSGEESDDEEDEEGGWRTAKDGSGGARDSPEEFVIKAGYLWKKGERRKTWKKRWFVLRPAHLAYYKSSAEYQLLRLLDLAEVHTVTPVELKRHSNTFGLVCPSRTYYLQAQTAGEVHAWVQAISDAREALLHTGTQNSTSSTPIAIPNAGAKSRHQQRASSPTPSPPSQYAHSHGVTSSDSDDAYSNDPRSFGASSPSRSTFGPQSIKNQTAAPPVDPSKTVVSGYLLKCGSKRRHWRKRWFVLNPEKLEYSSSHVDSKPHRSIALTQILDALEYDLPGNRNIPNHTSPPVTSPPQASNPATGEEADPSNKKHTFKIITTKRTLLLCAPSEEEEIKWLSAVRALIARRSGAGGVGTGGSASVNAGGNSGHPSTGSATKATSAGVSSGLGSNASAPPEGGGHQQHPTMPSLPPAPAGSGPASVSGGIRGIARRLSASAGSNAVPEEAHGGSERHR